MNRVQNDNRVYQCENTWEEKMDRFDKFEQVKCKGTLSRRRHVRLIFAGSQARPKYPGAWFRWFTPEGRSRDERRSKREVRNRDPVEEEAACRVEHDFLVISWSNKLLFASFAGCFHGLRWISRRPIHRKLLRQMGNCFNERGTSSNVE